MDYCFDEHYLNCLHASDPAAEIHLIGSFAPQVQRTVRKRFPSSHLAEDATQETLLRVLIYFRSGKTLRAASSLPGFVNSVSTHVSLEMFRKSGYGSPTPDQIPEPVDGIADPEKWAISEEQKHIVERALGTLDESDALLLKRVFLEEAGRDQLCREMQISRDYLRVMLHRAKQRLRSVLLDHKTTVKPATRRTSSRSEGPRTERVSSDDFRPLKVDGAQG